MKALSPSDCDNCGTALEGEYCHRCGQRKIDLKKDWKGITHEVLSQFLHLDGKMLVGLADLAFRPWRVIRGFLQGKRVSQIPPLRAYLFVSLIFFLSSVKSDFSEGFNSAGQTEAEASATINEAFGIDDENETTIDRELINELQDDFEKWMPRVFLVGVVVLAFILKLVFFRHHFAYLEHLIVALNLQTFTFLWLTIVSGFGNLLALVIPSLEESFMDLFFIWFLICPIIVFRKVFEVGYFKAILKSILVGLIYSTFLLFGLVVFGFLAAWSHDLI